MKKFYLILTLITVCVLIIPVYAAERTVDYADLLTHDEEISLTEMLDGISEKWSCDVVVVAVNSLEGYSVQAYADDFYDQNGYGYGSDYTGILFLISMDEREYALSTCGDAIRIFTDAGLMRIEDEVVGYLSSGDYYSGFTAFASVCDEILERAGSGEIYDNYGGYTGYEDYFSEYYPTEQYEKNVSGTMIPVSVIIGFIISLIVVNIMKGEMNTVHPASGASQFEKQGSFRVTQQQDIFLYRNVSKTLRQTEQPRSGGSYRGGGSTVHRSSSGRSHGGRSGRF